MVDFTRPIPHPTPTSAPFWEGLNQQRVCLQRCNDCQNWVFYPRSHCDACLSDDLTWHDVSGAGEIYSFTIAHRPTAPHFAGMEPQFIAVVELAEGVRLNTLIVHATAAQLRVGLPVKPVFDTSLIEQNLLYFEPA